MDNYRSKRRHPSTREQLAAMESAEILQCGVGAGKQVLRDRGFERDTIGWTNPTTGQTAHIFWEFDYDEVRILAA
jgi:hypothetical protein